VCELGLQRSRGGMTTMEHWQLARRLSGLTAPDPELDLFIAGEA
jgi:hypothetical protein